MVAARFKMTHASLPNHPGKTELSADYISVISRTITARPHPGPQVKRYLRPEPLVLPFGFALPRTLRPYRIYMY